MMNGEVATFNFVAIMVILVTNLGINLEDDDTKVTED